MIGILGQKIAIVQNLAQQAASGHLRPFGVASISFLFPSCICVFFIILISNLHDNIVKTPDGQVFF
jgi:hypothetical protein